MAINLKNSPDACKRLLLLVADNSDATLNDWDDAMGETDCPEGCYVEPDGYCSHGFKSAALTAGVI